MDCIRLISQMGKALSITGLMIFMVFLLSPMCMAAVVKDVIVNSVELAKDDEEAPFDIRSGNKVHKCGGEQSNIFRVYSDYEPVQQRRFMLALEALTSGRTLTLTTDYCEGAAMVIKKIRLHR